MILTFFFFFNDTATTEIYTLSLHDALPIYFFLSRVGRAELDLDVFTGALADQQVVFAFDVIENRHVHRIAGDTHRSEEHTSELQSRQYLVCRLLLEKKNKQQTPMLLLQLQT